ncbi:MAG: OmpA family protein [Hyphomonas sp.]|nr:OmpA family protein [Hyphomonas sp.]
MKVLDYLFAPVAFAGLLVAGWWGLYQSPQTPAKLEAQLQREANDALATAGYDWARVEMRGQRAVLRGPAPSEDAVTGAAETVLASSWSGGVLSGGVTIVEAAVDPGEPVSPFVWRAERLPDGAWILSGNVPSRRIAEQLESVARVHADGLQVENEMKVAAGAPAGNWQGAARLGLDILAQADAGEARFRDGVLRVNAVEAEPAKRARLISLVRNIAAPWRGEALVKGPAVWSARHSEEGLVLSGAVPTESVKTELAALAQAGFAGNVVDRMEVRDRKQADWLGGVRAGLPHFAKFTTGEMSVHPETADAGLAVEGTASGSVIAWLRQDMSAARGPYAVNIMADAADVPVSGIDELDFASAPAEACEQAFDTVLETGLVTFEGRSAIISRESGPTLDKLLTVSRKCAPDLLIELGGAADSAGGRVTDTALGEARATAVAEYMVSAGLDPARLSAIGYGPDQPAQFNDSPEGRAATRPVDFRVRTRSE